MKDRQRLNTKFEAVLARAERTERVTGVLVHFFAIGEFQHD